MAALSEDVLKKLISPNAKALSKPNGVENVMEDKDPREYNDFDDSLYLAETYNENTGIPQVSKEYQYDPNASRILESRKTTDYSSNNFNPDRIKDSGMLSAIKEDLINHPIDTTALNTQMIESAGGGNPLNSDRLSQMIARAKVVDMKAGELDGKGAPKRQQISETKDYAVGGNIDYALIKSIINECLETKLNEMAQKGLLTEGATLKGIGLSEGKIKLIDNQGRVFSAKLEYKGNAKEKK